MAINPDNAAPGQNRRRVISWPAIFLIILFDLIILGAGHFTYSSQKNRLSRRVEKDLEAVATLKVMNVVQWRNERIFNAEIFHKNQLFRRQLSQFLASPDDGLRGDLNSWLTMALNDENCIQAVLYDESDKLIATRPLLSMLIPSEIRKKISQVKLSDSVTIIDFFSQNPGVIHLGLVVPIPDYKDSGKLIGRLFLRIDPERYLYPFIEEWPSQSVTAETLLARQDGDSVVFLNNLRFEGVKPLQSIFSVHDTTKAASRGLNGRYGVYRSLDYYNTP